MGKTRALRLQEHPLGPVAGKVAKAYFANPSITQKALGELLGVTEKRVSQILNSPRVVSMYPILARHRRKELVPKAIQREEELMAQNENLEVSRKVVASVLESAKVLESEPKVQINIFNSMPNDDLKRIITDTKLPPDTYTDAEVVTDVQTSVNENSSTENHA